MTTKPPSSVKPDSGTKEERTAYAAVAGIPTVEPHDLDRLGYNVWQWLTTKRDTLEKTVHTAGARLLVSEEEAVATIRARLRDAGVQL
jgi:hypothetical protein